ncbi:MAG: hypothetical protein ACI9QD_000227 [Thermoproteota archaeon]|jgi:hypothetical protein
MIQAMEEQKSNVLDFKFGVQTQITEDPDDFISSMIAEYEDDNFNFDETLDEILAEDENINLSENHFVGLLSEDTPMSEALLQCQNMMKSINNKMNRIKFYVSEIDSVVAN